TVILRASNIRPCLPIPRSQMTTKIAHGLVLHLALASPPSPQQTAAGCAAPSPSRRVARSLLAGGGRPSGVHPDRRRSASRRGLSATGPFVLSCLKPRNLCPGLSLSLCVYQRERTGGRAALCALIFGLWSLS